MAVLALNQRQLLVGTQFVATFTGVAFDDALVVNIAGRDVVFNESAGLEFLSPQTRTSGEVRLLVLTDKVPSDVTAFSFQVHASNPASVAWVLNDPNSRESYQNYAAKIDAGKTLELLEFSREGEGWVIRNVNHTIGDIPLPPDQAMYAEHLRELALNARGLNAAGWSSVQAFVEVNEISQPHLLSQLYVNSLAAVQAIGAVVRPSALTIAYGTFGEASVEQDTRVDDAHRNQVKAIAAEGYASSKPTVEQLRKRVESMQSGGALIALVNTLGGFDVEEMVALLESRDCTLLLLAMRSVPFGIVPNLGESNRLRGFAVANLSDPTPRAVVDLLKTGR
jgi:hypothetical protein